jgi:hypothetical protein
LSNFWCLNTDHSRGGSSKSNHDIGWGSQDWLWASKAKTVHQHLQLENQLPKQNNILDSCQHHNVLSIPPRISADLTGALGFMALHLFFLSISHVFGSNTSASSWELLRTAVQNLIRVFSQWDESIKKHKKSSHVEMGQNLSGLWTSQKVFWCNINKGVLDEKENIKPLEAFIYVDDILGATAFKQMILRLLAAVIKAIFLVCGEIDLELRQCPLLLEKWMELLVGPRQVILGLVVDTNKMTVAWPIIYSASQRPVEREVGQQPQKSSTSRICKSSYAKLLDWARVHHGFITYVASIYIDGICPERQQAVASQVFQQVQGTGQANQN